MQTLKTALVVTFLLAVLYAVYVTLNKPDSTGAPAAFDDANQWAGPEVTLEFDSELSTNDSTGGAGAPSAHSRSFPLPQLSRDGSGSAAARSVQPVDPYADLTDPYANETNAPPLANADGTAESDDPADEDSGYRPLPSLPPYGSTEASESAAQPPASRNQSIYSSEPSGEASNDDSASAETPNPLNALPLAGSPYANARRESVSASEGLESDVDLGDTYRRHDAPTATDDDQAAASRASLGQYRFKQAWSQAQELINENKFARALAVLTLVYREADLPAENRRMLLDMLDRLAGTVIYSTEHRLELPYEVARGETLEQIAQKYQVPALLLYNINRGSVNEPDLLLPGTQLKVMRGPFRAEIEIDAADPSRGEATLFLGSLYAGRFPVTFGEDLPQAGREYKVIERLEGKPYYRASDQLAARAPDNPYGLYWLGFDDPSIGIHGQSRHGGEQDRRGSIRLSERDAADVYGILSVGSPVLILQ